jgi:hypothetical protein
MIKWVNFFVVAQAKVYHILRPGPVTLHSKNSLSLFMVSKDGIEGYMR